MKSDNPVPRFGFDQLLYCFPQKRCRRNSFGKCWRIKNCWILSLICMRSSLIKERINLAPTSFIHFKETMFLFKFFKIRCSAFSLRAIYIIPSPDGEVIINLFYSLFHGISMKNSDFYSGKEVVNKVSGCKNCNRFIIKHFLYCF